MATRPSYILPSELDARGPDFHAKYVVWRAQMRSEIKETVALTKVTIAGTRVLMAEADRLLGRR
jgi:hypothetical protein